ncbi:MAG: TonB-dependent receptor [Dysgonamonadaceae bacterium]|nr:TonB-dependent receptor [Dysgonamonadaceae bacterium]
MKHLIFLTILFVAIPATSAFSQIKVTGKVVDNKKEPLEFANIVIHAADTLFGTYSGDNGLFELQAVPGNDTVKVFMLGYETYEKVILLQSNADLGEIQLENMPVEMKEVVVTGQRITRRADRFIMNLANDPTAFGKDGVNILNTAPGVFIQERDGSISVNGKSGTRVYVNERPRHETGMDLLRYLQNLKAEDIVKIEILPNAGAEYDANVTGGIIKITLKNRRDDGIDGNAGASYFFSPEDKDFSGFSPFYNMNYRFNKLSLYTQLNYNIHRAIEHIDEKVNMKTANSNRQSIFTNPQKVNRGQARIGGFYDLSDKQSIGLEVNYSDMNMRNSNYANLTDITDGNQTDVAGNYSGKMMIDNYSISANYLLRLDSLGSMFKILLDYFHNKLDYKQNFNAEYSGYINLDSIYRNNTFTKNNTYAVTADWSHHFNETSMLSAGVKYARNEMNNNILFEYLQGVNWNEIDPFSSINSFTENISAIYGLFSSNIWKISYSLGLRGEYTQASPRTNKTEETKTQQYFELFPSINVLFPLNKDGKHSLVASYKRTIQRPTFNDLNPYRYPGSEYTFLEGNPDLQPAFTKDYSLAFNLFYRYNIIVGTTDTKGAFNRVTTLDPATSSIIIHPDNVAKNTNFYLALNGPVKPVEWWQIYLNLNGSRNKLEILGKTRTINVFNGFMSNTFYLPKEYMLDLTGNYSSPFLMGNTKMIIEPQVNISLRKQFFNKRLTANLFVNNLFNWATQRISVDETDFYQEMRDRANFRVLGLSLSYSFQSGKKSQEKKVESGAKEEKARLQ